MFTYAMDPEGILILEPYGTLNEEGFAHLTAFVDTYLADHADIRGVLIHSKSFPGWDSFASFVAHMRFIRNHHQKVERVAVVTDSSIARLAETLGKHFIVAEVKHFPYADYEKALNWLKNPGSETQVDSGTGFERTVPYTIRPNRDGIRGSKNDR